MKADEVTNEAPFEITGRHGILMPSDQAAIALSLTAAIVAFVGAVVVFSIPYAVLSVSLPSRVNPLGLSGGSFQKMFFGSPWHILVPAIPIAVWIGYRSYSWCCSTSDPTTKSGKATNEIEGQDPPTESHQ